MDVVKLAGEMMRKPARREEAVPGLGLPLASLPNELTFS
jgi:hypothetical protein